MYVAWLAVGVGVCGWSYVWLFKRVPRRALVPTLLVLSITWLCLSALLWAYAFRPKTRAFLQTFTRPVALHRVVGTTRVLPLPPHTAFVHRYSYEESEYFTRGSEDDVVAFYGSVSKTLTVDREDSATRVSIITEGSTYEIAMDPQPYGVRIRVKSLQ